MTLAAALAATYRARWSGLASEDDRWREGCDVVARLGEARRVVELRQADVDRLRAELEREGLAAGTIRKRLAALSAILRTARSHGAAAPELDLRGPRPSEGRERVLSEAEEAPLLETLRGSGERGPELADLAGFLLATGCRWSEAAGMLGRDVTRRDGRAWVTFPDTKNGRRRTLPVPQRCAERVWIGALTAGPDGRIWPVPYTTFKGAFDRAVARLGLDGLVPHSLRHTCITRLLRKGIDPIRVKEWAGHRTLETTMRYTHLVGKDLESVADAIG